MFIFAKVSLEFKNFFQLHKWANTNSSNVTLRKFNNYIDNKKGSIYHCKYHWCQVELVNTVFHVWRQFSKVHGMQIAYCMVKLLLFLFFFFHKLWFHFVCIYLAKDIKDKILRIKINMLYLYTQHYSFNV